MGVGHDDGQDGSGMRLASTRDRMGLASARDRMGQVWDWLVRGTGWVRYGIG
jgi:hypothetical protein